MQIPPSRSRRLARRAVLIASALAVAFVGTGMATEPFRGWAPLKTRPLHPKYAVRPAKTLHPQPLVTIPPIPEPYPYGYFGAVGPHSNVEAGPGSSPGTRAWSYSFRR